MAATYTTTREVLAALKAGKITEDDADRLLEEKKNVANPLRLKISPEKGCVCLYGVNSRFPVALYASQWKRVLEYGPSILKFIADNSKELAKHAK